MHVNDDLAAGGFILAPSEPSPAATRDNAAIPGLSSPNDITRIHKDSRHYPNPCALDVPCAILAAAAFFALTAGTAGWLSGWSW